MIATPSTRRAAFLLLGLFPLIVAPLVGIRALRVEGLYESIGLALLGGATTAAWVLGGRTIVASRNPARLLALAGLLLVAPFVLMSFLWIGLGTPWESTPTENRMRYLVLLASSIAVTGGFVALARTLASVSERFHATAGVVAGVLAGAAYLVWTSFEVGIYAVLVREEQVPPAIHAMSDVYDILLFVGSVLTYVATSAFAAALRSARWLGRRATAAYVAICLVAIAFLLLRGLAFPDPMADSTPWYLRPGFVAGIPAVPWILPFFMGVLLLRRAGDERTLIS